MASAKRLITVVEDEDGIRETLTFALEQEGFGVEAFGDGQEAWAYLQARLPELIILDILLPGLDGLELCRRLRKLSETLPIIFLTSRDEEIDRVVGLEIGADDYLCKPFSMRELMARVKVLLRRLDLLNRVDLATPRQPGAVAQVGSLYLDLDCFLARWEQGSISLTVTEFRILASLARNPGHVRTRTQLIEAAYSYDVYVEERTVDSHIKRIRRKLGEAGGDPSAIETVHGLGYRYRVP